MKYMIYNSTTHLVAIIVALMAMASLVQASPSVEAMMAESERERVSSNKAMVSPSVIDDLEQRIAELEQMLSEVKRKQVEAMQAMQAQQEAMQAQQATIAMQAEQEEIAMQKPEKSSGFSLSPSNSKLSFYGSIRPAVTYFDSAVDNPHGFVYEIVDPNNPQGSAELSDFFSRIGIKGETEVADGLTAFIRGEMEVAIDQNGDFDPRLAYAGVKGGFGRLAIGRQWHPHYNIIVEVSDLYNHRSSPFGYDRQSPFRRPGLVTYSNSVSNDFGTFKLDTALQLTHDRNGRNGGISNDDRAGPDSGSIGVSYSNDRFYLGLSHLKRNRGNGHSRDFYGVGVSVNLSDNLYIATTAQGIKQGRDVGGHDNGHSVDVVGAYAMDNGYKLIVGYVDVDAVGRGNPVDLAYTDGYNLTLQRQISDNFRVFVEWLHFDYDHAAAGTEDNVNAISTGLRYDFSIDLL